MCCNILQKNPVLDLFEDLKLQLFVTDVAVIVYNMFKFSYFWW